MHTRSSAEALNGDCHSAMLSRTALQHSMQAQGDAWHSLVTERCPFLFAEVAVFISTAQLQQMRDVIGAVERVVKLPGWKNIIIPAQAGIQSVEKFSAQRSHVENASLISQLDGRPSKLASSGSFSRLRGNDGFNDVHLSAKGVFYGYDFHLNEQGAHLIEINTNAGGGFLNALLLDSQREAVLPGVAVCGDDLEQTFLAMFRNEWRLVHGEAPLKTIAIVDEQPEGQYLYPEFLLAKKLFESAGVAAHIVDPSALQAREDGLYCIGQRIDLIYNRLTDFSLRQYPALRQAYLDGRVVLTPDPAHFARYADKRNLSRLSDAQALRALGANEADIAILQAGVPYTIVVQPRLGGAEHSGAGGAAKQLLPQSAGFASNVSQLHPSMEEALWAERKQWFFKPNSGYGSKGAYRGEKLTRRVYAGILLGDYVAQKMAAPGERSVCLNDAEAVSLKYDVRCYVYDGKIQLVAARLYQGQTTNFRTPGGGFALVRVVE